MIISLLRTKFYIPPVRSALVPRPRLIERLDESVCSTKLTLISAPAGSGKTLLLSAWVATAARSVAWFSLDGEDNDPTRFLENVVAALQTIHAEFGADVPSVLQSPEVPPLELPLTLLINDLAEAPLEGDQIQPRVAGDSLRAAQVVETYGYRHFEKADFHQLSHWLESLPLALIETRPWL